jgi:hypothetical protein
LGAVKKIELYLDSEERENSRYRQKYLKNSIRSLSKSFDHNKAFQMSSDHSWYPNGVCSTLLAIVKINTQQP